MASSISFPPYLGMRSTVFKALAVLSVFLIVLCYHCWHNFRIISCDFALAKAPATDFHFDHPTGQNWTKIIWQTSKDPLAAISDEGTRNIVKSWSDLNPEYRHEVLTDQMRESYVKEHFDLSHPELVEIYFQIQDYIVRSDLIRYLVLLADGGVYNDLDVGCEKPISTWVPRQYQNDAGIILGVEVDNNFGPDGRTFTGGVDLFELVNWTIMAKPNQPFVRFLVKRVVENIKYFAASKNLPISQMTYTVEDVIDITGPAALTSSFLEYASDISGTNVTYLNFTKIREPKLVGEVVILPIQAFGAGHQVEWAGWKQDGTALVHHYFAGSWKTDHVSIPKKLTVDEGKDR